MQYQFVYLNVVTVCYGMFKWIRFRMFKWLGGPRKTFPEVVHNTCSYIYIYIFKSPYIYRIDILWSSFDHHLAWTFLSKHHWSFEPLISAVAIQVLSPIAVVFGGRSLPPKFHTLMVNLAPRCASCPENPELLLPCRQYHAWKDINIHNQQ